MDAIDILLLAGIAWLAYSVVNPAPLESLVQSIETGASDIMSTTRSAAVIAIARAIAAAEGFYNSGSLPQRAHNPGDLEIGDVGHGMINSKTIFSSDDEGWAQLYNQVERMLHLHGVSIYSPDMSISEVAAMWVNGKTTPNTDSASWAHNVSSQLGVTPDTTLIDAAGRYS